MSQFQPLQDTFNLLSGAQVPHRPVEEEPQNVNDTATPDVDLAHVSQWLVDYVNAWKSYDPQAIGALFSEDATYRYNPFDEEPTRGREAIVADWLENPDEPNRFDAEYKALALNGDTAIAQGRSIYYEADGKTIHRQFDNIFVLRFDTRGQCAEFTEWYMQPRGQG